MLTWRRKLSSSSLASEPREEDRELASEIFPRQAISEYCRCGQV